MPKLLVLGPVGRQWLGPMLLLEDLLLLHGRLLLLLLLLQLVMVLLVVWMMLQIVLAARLAARLTGIGLGTIAAVSTRSPIGKTLFSLFIFNEDSHTTYPSFLRCSSSDSDSSRSFSRLKM